MFCINFARQSIKSRMRENRTYGSVRGTLNVSTRPFAHILFIITFLVNTFGSLPLAQADEFLLPAPGVMVHLSPPLNPPILKGIKVYPNNPFHFEFILDKGDSELSNDQLKDESSKLIKYFLTSLTIPEKDLWVNLSPYEKNKIIPPSFGLTGMGRDLLAEDYMLKQITASLIYPEDSIGKEFWKKIYAKAEKEYGTTNIPINTFNKVWIVPEKAVVYENAKAGTAYVVQAKLKVMLEQDYLSLREHEAIEDPITKQRQNTSQIGSEVVRQIVLPELEKEVNAGKNFTKLRQSYNSLILATWYKKKIVNSILEQVYADKKKIAGVNINDPQETQKIYNRYLQAFKKGVYSYIKDEIDPITHETMPRKYFSGGVDLSNFAQLSLQIVSHIDAAQLNNHDLFKARVNLEVLGKMKKPGLREFKKELPKQNIGILGALKKVDVNQIPIKYEALEEGEGGYYYYSLLGGGWHIVINSSLSKEIQEEALFHERKEIELRKGSHHLNEHDAHIIASALQRLKFSKNDQLTEFDKYVLEHMSMEELWDLYGESTVDKRKKHKEIISEYFKILGLESDIEKVMAYEKVFLDKVGQKVDHKVAVFNYVLKKQAKNIQIKVFSANDALQKLGNKMKSMFMGKLGTTPYGAKVKGLPFGAHPKSFSTEPQQPFKKGEQLLSPMTVEELGPEGKINPVTYTLFGDSKTVEPNLQAADIFERLDAFEQAESKVMGLLMADDITVGDVKTLVSALRHMVVIYLKLFKNFPSDIQGQGWSEEQIIKEAADHKPGDLPGGENIARAFQYIETDLNEKTRSLPSAQVLPEEMRSHMRGLNDQKTLQLVGKPAEEYAEDQIKGITFHELINIVHQKGLKNLDGVFVSIKGERSNIFMEIKGADVQYTPHIESFGNTVSEVDLKSLQSAFQSTLMFMGSQQGGLAVTVFSQDSQVLNNKFQELVPTILVRAKQGDPDAIMALAVGYNKLNENVQHEFLDDLKDKLQYDAEPYWGIVARASGKIMSQIWLTDKFEAQIIYKMLRTYAVEGNELIRPKAYLGLAESGWGFIKSEYLSDFDHYKGELISLAKGFPEYFEVLMSMNKEIKGEDKKKLDEIFQWYMQHPYPGVSKGIKFYMYPDMGEDEVDQIKKQVRDSKLIGLVDKIVVAWHNRFSSYLSEETGSVILQLTPTEKIGNEYWQEVLPAIAKVYHMFPNQDVRKVIGDNILKHIELHTPGSLEALASVTPFVETTSYNGDFDKDKAMSGNYSTFNEDLNPNSQNGFRLSYIDARRNPTSPTPLAMRYVAQAFSLGQGLSKNYRLFPPSKARIVVGDNLTWISMPLGLHSATVRFNLKPLQDGGGITVSYKDSGTAFAPGSSIRLNALAQAFKEEGFRVEINGIYLQAYFDKNNGVNLIDELPQKLHFVVQALSSTLDMDLRLNYGFLLHDFKNQRELENFLVILLLRQGFWFRNGSSSNPVTEESLKVNFPDDMRQKVVEEARKLGLDVKKEQVSLRYLQGMEREKNRLNQRGARLESPQGWFINPEYLKAQAASPLDYLLNRLFLKDEKDRQEAKQMAAVAWMARSYTDDIKLIGAVGRYQVQKITVNALEDPITFLLLTDIQSQQPVLAYALLGEFFYDHPRLDILRDKRLPNNALSLTDVREILTLNNITTSSSLRQWIKTNNLTLLGANQENDDIFNILSQIGLNSDFWPHIDWESFKHLPANIVNISPINVAGKPVYPDAVIGQAIFRKDGSLPADFKDNILFADVTDTKDDPLIEAASGVVVTQGGPQAHAAIRSKELKKAGLIINQVSYEPARIVFKALKGEISQHNKLIDVITIKTYEYSNYELQDTAIENGDLVYLDSRSGNLYLLAKKDNQEAISTWQRYRQWRNVPTVDALVSILIEANEDNLIRAILSDVLIHSRLNIDQIERVIGSLIQQKPIKKQAIIPFLQEQTRLAIENFRNAQVRLQEQLQNPDRVEQLLLDVDRLEQEVRHCKKLLSLMNGGWNDPNTLIQINEIEASLIKESRVHFEVYRNLLEKEAQNADHRENITLKQLIDLSNRLRVVGLSMKLISPSTDLRLRQMLEQRRQKIEGKLNGHSIIWKEELGDVIQGTMSLGNAPGFVRSLAGGKGAQSSEITYALAHLKDIGFLNGDWNVVNPLGFMINPSEYKQWDQSGRPEQVRADLVLALQQSYRELVKKQIDSIKDFIKKDQRTTDEMKEKFLTYLNANTDDIETLNKNINRYLNAYGLTEGMSKSLRNRLSVIGLVAVRSSGLNEDNLQTAGAGKFKTVLGVVGTEKLVDAVLEVWRSGAEGVLIEEMINAKQSLLIFSADDVNKNTHMIKMDVVDGLAQGLVAQTVKDPDSYILEKGATSVRVLGEYSHVGAKQECVTLNSYPEYGIRVSHREPVLIPALNEQQILAMGHTVQLLEKYFGMPLDIEASFDTDNRLVILQARPITTLNLSLQRGLEVMTKTDRAMYSGLNSPGARSIVKNTGGIDLTPANLNLQIQNAGQGIKFYLDPAMIQQLQNASGFVPVIIDIQPMTDVKIFLGLKETGSKIDFALK